jgi:hypothetical protein
MEDFVWMNGPYQDDNFASAQYKDKDLKILIDQDILKQRTLLMQELVDLE